MKEYTVRKAKQEDIEYIRGRTTEGKVDDSVIRESSETRALLYKDTPIVLVGAVEYPTGNERVLLSLWGLFDKSIEKNTRHTFKVVRFIKDLITDRVGVTFVVLIDESEPKYVRWITYLGFSRTEHIEMLGRKKYHIYIKEN